MPLIPNKPLCRFYYNEKLKGKERKCRNRCLFYHPENLNDRDTEEFNRDIGYCYCGAPLITIVNRKYGAEDENDKIFMVVCGLTFKGKNRCRRVK